MDHQTGPNDSLVLSYLGLRKAVGILGIALPFILALGKILLEGPGILSTISGYYYTEMRGVFVGTLFAIATFLMSYRGYERTDDIAGDLACGFALGVALFPTTPEVNATPQDRIVGALHLFCAAGFLLTLAFFSLALFRKTDPTKTPTRQKLQRNTVYTVCGYAILASLVLSALARLLPGDSPVNRLDPVFWFESAAVVAFGISWLTKGEAILKDAAT
jgi:hypothetical protein